VQAAPAMTDTAEYGGILLRLEYPNGKTAEVYLCEIADPNTLWRLTVMSAHFGVPIICAPRPRLEAA